MSSAPHWWAKGLLFENCSCQLLSPAHISFKQTCENDICVGHWAIHVTEARFGDTVIHDRDAVVVFEAPIQMYEGNWIQRVYIDERASEPERTALETILTGAAGGPWERLGQFVATRLDTRVIPVIYEDDGSEKRMTIPSLFETTVAAIRGRDDTGHAVLSNLYNVIRGMVHVLALGQTTCHDAPFSIATKRTHGLYSDFSWSAAKHT